MNQDDNDPNINYEDETDPNRLIAKMQKEIERDKQQMKEQQNKVQKQETKMREMNQHINKHLQQSLIPDENEEEQLNEEIEQMLEYEMDDLDKTEQEIDLQEMKIEHKESQMHRNNQKGEFEMKGIIKGTKDNKNNNEEEPKKKKGFAAFANKIKMFFKGEEKNIDKKISEQFESEFKKSKIEKPSTEQQQQQPVVTDINDVNAPYDVNSPYEPSSQNTNPLDDYYNKQQQDNNNNRAISHNLYRQVDPKELHIITLWAKKCNEKLTLGLKSYSDGDYITAHEIFSKTKACYKKLLSNLEEKKDVLPKQFLFELKQKIHIKINKTSQYITKTYPLAYKQKYGLTNQLPNTRQLNTNQQMQDGDMNINRNMYNPNQGNNIRNNNQPKRDNNMFQHNINNDNNLFRSMNNLSMKKWQQTNQNQRLPPSNQQPQQQQPKKKGLHDKEDDEMDAKIESEIMSSNPGVKFSDIVGMKDLKQIIYEIIIMPNVRPDLFTGLRQPQRGLLLFGPPGTGKTMIAKAIASECESTFFNISASSLTSKWVGESEKTVRSLFKLAYAKQPSIIFIDEIDSVLSKRSDNDNEAAKRLKTEFLIQFDGLGSNSSAKLLVIAATNRPMDLDDALLRRLPKRVYCGPLDEEGRFSYIKKLLESVEYNIKDEDIMRISKKTDGYSNSDLLEICREAAYEPVREKTTEEILQLHKFRPLVISDFEKALTKIRGSISAQVMKEMDKWNKTYGAI